MHKDMQERPPPLGREFTGMARRFRAAALAEDTKAEAALNTITAPLRRRLRSAPSLRREQIMGSERQ